MKAALRKFEPAYPITWDDLPKGDMYAQALAGICDQYSQRIFGYHLVKMGSLSSYIDLPSCQIKRQYNYTRQAQHNSDIVGDPYDLPFQSNSVDGFLLAHELDFARDPHHLLREVDRSITSSGYVIVSGFNPVSMAGVIKLSRLHKHELLHHARFFTCARVKDWLQLLGFEVIEHQYVMHSSLFWQYGDYPSRLQRWCEHYLPWAGAGYVILARKREMPITPIKSKLKLKPKFAPIGASIRTSVNSMDKLKSR